LPWLIATVAALLGAAGAGVFGWFLVQGSERRTAEAARVFLLENYRVVEDRLAHALTSNWWPPPADSFALTAWDEYHAILRADLDDTMRMAIAETSDRLRQLSAWAVTRWAEDAERFQIYQRRLEAELFPQTSAEDRSEIEAAIERSKPVRRLAFQDRAAIESAKHLVAQTRSDLSKEPSRLASDAKRRLRSAAVLAGLAAVIALVVVVILPATRVSFTTDSLANALSERFPSSVVSCDELTRRRDTWDCTIAQFTAAAPKTTLRTAQTEASTLMANGSGAGGLKTLLEAIFEQQGNTDRYLGVVVSQEPPESDDVSSVGKPAATGFFGLPPSPVDDPDDILTGVIH
jgi:hypothetical protein